MCVTHTLEAMRSPVLPDSYQMGLGGTPRSTCWCRAPQMLLPDKLLPEDGVQQTLGGVPRCQAPCRALQLFCSPETSLS